MHKVLTSSFAVLATVGVALLHVAVVAVTGAYAQGVTRSFGQVEVNVRAFASAQYAHFQDSVAADEAFSRRPADAPPVPSNLDTDGEYDFSLVLNGEYVAPNGLIFGARAEFDAGDRKAEDLSRDEFYLYMAGAFGRVELGEQDGPADTLAFRAPLVGLGQIRGDFSRYAGTPALLSALDTRDALKIVYLSPPQRGLRFGVSFAPEFESNSMADDPRLVTRQHNAVELGLQYQTAVADWALGASAGYVHGEADDVFGTINGMPASARRQDIASWSTGLHARHGRVILSGAYVSRGDSNRLSPGFDQVEVNAGIAWRGAKWDWALSAARTDAKNRRNDIVGAGFAYDLTDHVVLRTDVIGFEETFTSQRGTYTDDGFVTITEIGFRF